MNDELSPAARALLDAARDGLTPPPSTLRRVRSKVDAAVVATATPIAVKLALVAVVGAVAAGTLATRSSDPIVAPELALSTTAPHELRVERKQEAPPPAHVEIEPEIEPAPLVRAAAARAKRVVAPSPPPAPAPTIDLAREVELVDAAMAALQRNDPRTALASVRIHREETANRGQLAEDAAAIEIEALCKLGDARAEPKLAAFDTRWPRSAQRSRVTISCHAANRVGESSR